MKKYQSNNENTEVNELYEAVLSLESIEECSRFFEDVCTAGEINSLSQRLLVAKLLKEGNTFNFIEEKTGASSATISRVNRCINYGSGGYDIVLERNKKK